MYTAENIFRHCRVIEAKTPTGENFDILFHPGYRQVEYPHPHTTNCGALMEPYIEGIRQAGVSDNHSAYIIRVHSKKDRYGHNIPDTVIGIMVSDFTVAIFEPDHCPEYEACTRFLNECRKANLWCKYSGNNVIVPKEVRELYYRRVLNLSEGELEQVRAMSKCVGE